MKKFFYDYWKLCNESGAFMREHWIGVILMNLILMSAMMTYYYPQWLKLAWEKAVSVFPAKEEKSE